MLFSGCLAQILKQVLGHRILLKIKSKGKHGSEMILTNAALFRMFSSSNSRVVGSSVIPSTGVRQDTGYSTESSDSRARRVGLVIL